VHAHKGTALCELWSSNSYQLVPEMCTLVICTYCKRKEARTTTQELACQLVPVTTETPGLTVAREVSRQCKATVGLVPQLCLTGRPHARKHTDVALQLLQAACQQISSKKCSGGTTAAISG
jgi:hypothetical protein